jgi:hypothetical protein
MFAKELVSFLSWIEDRFYVAKFNTSPSQDISLRQDILHHDHLVWEPAASRILLASRCSLRVSCRIPYPVTRDLSSPSF